MSRGAFTSGSEILARVNAVKRGAGTLASVAQIEGWIAELNANTIYAAAWLAQESGMRRLGEIVTGTGLYRDKSRLAVTIGVRVGLIHEHAPELPGEPVFFSAMDAARPLAALLERSNDSGPKLTGAQLRGRKVAGWLKANPGYHAPQQMAAYFLFSRWDLLDALEAAEAEGLVQSKMGEFGMRRWAWKRPATDADTGAGESRCATAGTPPLPVQAGATAGETAASHERAGL